MEELDKIRLKELKDSGDWEWFQSKVLGPILEAELNRLVQEQNKSEILRCQGSVRIVRRIIGFMESEFERLEENV